MQSQDSGFGLDKSFCSFIVFWMLFQRFDDFCGHGFVVFNQILTVGYDVFLLAIGGGVFVHLRLVAEGIGANGGHQALDGVSSDAVRLKIAVLGGTPQGAHFIRRFGGNVQHDLPEEILTSASVGQGGLVVNSFD